ncbi:MAG: hypothetical protein GY817_02275, partial [bacterium]|nr:hypothetical protein [bacterium]
MGKGLYTLGKSISSKVVDIYNDPKATAEDIYKALKSSKDIITKLGPKGSVKLIYELSGDIVKHVGKEAAGRMLKFAKEFADADLEKKGIILGKIYGEFLALELGGGAIGKAKKLKNTKFVKNLTKAITRIVKEQGKTSSATKKASKEIIKLAKKKKIKAKITYKKDSFKV